MTKQEQKISMLIQVGMPKKVAECIVMEHPVRCGHGDLYAKVLEQRDHFEAMSKEPGRGNEDYYSGMASGLTVALQVIDRPRYEREAREPRAATSEGGC